MNNNSLVQRFKNLPGPQRTALAVVALLFLWFSGWFSIVSIAFGTWWLWSWWQKRSSKKSPQVFSPTTQQQPSVPPTAQAQQTPPPSAGGQVQQNQPGQSRPSINWRNQP